jgi:hypothetical protein
MIYIRGMLGLGDNVYQRGIVQILSQNDLCVVETPWPQIYLDLPRVICTPAPSRLRTQTKNVRRSLALFKNPPYATSQRFLNLTYVPWQRQGVPLYQGLCYCAGIDPKDYFLQLRTSAIERKDHVIIRPHTLRTEWLAKNRGPDPSAIQFAIDWCNAKGLKTIVVADIDPPLEYYDGPRPLRATEYYERGELPIERLIDLFHTARFVVGTVGFAIPLSMAVGAPAIILHGGAGGLNGPDMVDAPCQIPLRHVTPKNFCRCVSYEHDCDRFIPLDRLETALNECYESTRPTPRMEVGERHRVPASQEVVPVR